LNFEAITAKAAGVQQSIRFADIVVQIFFFCTQTIFIDMPSAVNNRKYGWEKRGEVNEIGIENKPSTMTLLICFQPAANKSCLDYIIPIPMAGLVVAETSPSI
jgi:hypothetical protein